jgi:uncharacterized protein YceK
MLVLVLVLVLVLSRCARVSSILRESITSTSTVRRGGLSTSTAKRQNKTMWPSPRSAVFDLP